MSIRPPRPVRRRRSRQARDLVVVACTSVILVVVLLRCLLAAFEVDSTTIAWRIVDRPTGLLIDPLERIEPLARTPVADLTIATLLVAFIVSIAALVTLGTLANRRD